MDKQLVLSIILISLIFTTTNTVIKIEKSKNKIKKVEKELEINKTLNKSLSQRINEMKKEEFIEKVAIENLNMTKDGYRLIINNQKDSTDININRKNSNNNKTESNWQLWKKKLQL